MTRFLLMGLAAVVLVAAPAAFWIREHAQIHALGNAQLLTQQLADYSVAPLITEELLAGDPRALARLDSSLSERFKRGSIVRLKVWDADGRIIYSDLPSLIGREFGLPDWGPQLLAGGEGRATLEHQHEAENEHEVNADKLVEVYVRSVAASGDPLIFEAYYDDGGVRREQHAVLLGMAPAFLASLAVLQLAQLIPAIRLARRIQAHQRTRRGLLEHAINASDLERQRIARDLHDEVIQDLAGLSYAMEAEEQCSDNGQRPLLTQARNILQRNVRILRSMTRDLYPPDLEELGLPAALTRLVEPLLERGLEVRLELPERCDLDREQSALFYRVAREVLRNTVKHADARRVELSLRLEGDHTVMHIQDDGCGFDPAVGAPDVHLGLKIMRDTLHQAGGSLEIGSPSGGGTSIVATVRNSGR